MTYEELKNWLLKVKLKQQSLKKSTAQLKAAIESICAFLNYEGGCVLIGVTE